LLSSSELLSTRSHPAISPHHCLASSSDNKRRVNTVSGARGWDVKAVGAFLAGDCRGGGGRWKDKRENTIRMLAPSSLSVPVPPHIVVSLSLPLQCSSLILTYFIHKTDWRAGDSSRVQVHVACDSMLGGLGGIDGVLGRWGGSHGLVCSLFFLPFFFEQGYISLISPGAPRRGPRCVGFEERERRDLLLRYYHFEPLFALN